MQFDPDDLKLKNIGGKPDICYLSADFLNAEFLLLFGHLALEANYGPTHIAQRVMEGLSNGRMTMVVVDPRMSKTSAKAAKWIAPIPGTDVAIIWGMIRAIIENKRYDEKFIQNANAAAAKADGEPSWSNGTHLVKIEGDGPGGFLRAKEIGLEDSNKVVVMQGGKPVAVDPNDAKTAVDGEIFFAGEVEGAGTPNFRRFKVKTGWQIIRDYAFSRSLEEWSKICGIDVETIVWLAKEFTSHGKKAVADAHRGLATNGSGSLSVLALDTLNALIGNMDWKGGFSKGGGSWDFKGGKAGQPYPTGNFPGKTISLGLPISKQTTMIGVGYNEYRYENTTLFEGYPAKRPWYGPAKWGIFQEPIPAAAAGYPYKIKALWIACWATPLAAISGAQPQIDILSDVHKIPLVFANDTTIADTAMFADYIIPDVSYLEELQVSKWPSSNLPHKANPIRQPVVAPVVENCKVFGQEMPISMEATHLAFAERLGLPGFGKNAFGSGDDMTHWDQFQMKMAANIAWGDKEGDAVPDADDKEIEIFKKARLHLPNTVYNYDRWQKAVGDKLWRKVVYVLNRGGRFEAFEKAYDGDKLGNKYSKQCTVYNDFTAQMIHPGTGKRLPGIGEWQPLQDFLGNDLSALDAKAGYRYTFITYKLVGAAVYHHQPAQYWIQELVPENYVVMHVEDAKRDGYSDGEMVKLVSASNPEGSWDLKHGRRYPVGGKIKTTTGIRQGVVAISGSYGHWAYGAVDTIVDGQLIKGDPRRGTGINPNAIIRLDPVLKDVTPSDPVGGQQAIPTRVNVVRMTAAEIAQLRTHVPGSVLVEGTTKTYLGGA